VPREHAHRPQTKILQPKQAIDSSASAQGQGAGGGDSSERADAGADVIAEGGAGDIKEGLQGVVGAGGGDGGGRHLYRTIEQSIQR
jgi:hypothetical protein